ncbi:SH3 domain-containing protein [Devosia sp. ZB163]|uniref:SH3 domain-containing protein n=1 Tax=Devosia sp. ZB163 TaxID=3025938 RepID=UPI0023601051|nr:SH3 domain-containing protein [Devosia sp. ZB163]MDC9825597.1 SH3 domain-containing protein [Devosia sp. ZB163]
MPLHRLTLGVTGALLALGLGVSAASAATAFASATVNVRSGSGTGFSVVDVLRPGQQVEVDHCRGSWCYVRKSGPDGWVSANYLSAGRSYDDDYGYDDYDDYEDDDFVIERPRYRARPIYPIYRSEFCWGGQRASFCVSD